MLEIILDENKPAASAAASATPAGAKRRVLIAENPQGYSVLAKVLGEEFTLVPVHTLTEGLDLLQNSAIARHQGIDAIVCGQHFEGSQMLRFLECVKAYKATSAIPFICCRVTATQLGDTTLAAMAPTNPRVGRFLSDLLR